MPFIGVDVRQINWKWFSERIRNEYKRGIDVELTHPP